MRETRKQMTYVGATETAFKVRLCNHEQSFESVGKSYDAQLAKHIWQSQEERKRFDLP